MRSTSECDAWTPFDNPFVERNTMTLEFGEAGLVTGEVRLLISCTVLPQRGPNRISVDAY